MAMNKAEKKLVEDLKINISLRFTDRIEPDLQVPSFGALGTERFIKGWNYNEYRGQAFKSCSTNINHGEGWEKTSTQQPIRQYSTEMLALKALRNRVEIICAKKLRDIDKKIELCAEQKGR